MSKRRSQLQAMMAPVQTPQVEERRPVASGSLKAMGLSLRNLSDEADQARTLKAQLASGSAVIEIDPGLIDPSFIRDRLEVLTGTDFEAFKASLAEDGQQVPILVRPVQDGRYQTAYGHRRIAALKALGRPVKAVVRDLTDEQLVIAQGKENTDRRDLSFIERALFAARLEDRGFPRSALSSALSLQKGNLSTMITVAREIPEDVIVAIGPAPKIGRPRWEQLAGLFKGVETDWRSAIDDGSLSALSSDQRFEKVLKAVSHPARKSTRQAITSAEGRPIASANQTRRATRLIIDEKKAPEFGTYLLEQLPEIYAAFQRRKDA